MAKDLKYLELLSKSFPTVQAASTEIINLEAILNLPKGTEHFVTDLHGQRFRCHQAQGGRALRFPAQGEREERTLYTDLLSRAETQTGKGQGEGEEHVGLVQDQSGQYGKGA